MPTTTEPSSQNGVQKLSGLRVRVESFPSLGSLSLGLGEDEEEDDDDEENGGIVINDRQQELEDENERLRQQVNQLKVKVARLQSQVKQQKNKREKESRANNRQRPSIILELPDTLRQAAQASSPLKCCGSARKNGNGVILKEERSLSTQDGQETVEPQLELEAHASARGLHHRNASLQHPQQPLQQQQKFRSPTETTTKTDPTSTDDSFSSSDGTGTSEGVESQDLLRLRGSNDGIMVAGGDDDEEAYNEDEGFLQNIMDRAGWLVGLLVLQSMSSFILARNEALLQSHLVIVRFLTMLVGAGGNAGNQASVRVIRGLAVGSIDNSNVKRFLRREFMGGALLSLILGVAGCIRAAVFFTPFLETFAITTSLFMIVFISVIFGALLPLGMDRLGIDPAHSSTTIQVIMDILGVAITVHVCSLVLDGGLSDWLKQSVMDGR